MVAFRTLRSQYLKKLLEINRLFSYYISCSNKIHPYLQICFIIFLRLCSYLKTDTLLDHIFITRSFLYPTSISFGVENKSTVVALVNLEKTARIQNLKTRCVFELNDGSAYSVNAEVYPIHDEQTSECRLHNFRVVCHSDLKMHLGSYIALRLRNTTPLKLLLTPVDNVKRNFVVCPGRMFAFDQWHLFVTGMEIYRLYQVDLVIIYIQSVDVKVYKLIEFYKMDGLVQFRHSLRMPEMLPTLKYNPNAETTWNNQLINFNDCLYEFRESADFIAFPDWDELIVTEQQQPLASLFQQIVKDQPNAASFLFERTTGSMQKLESMKSHKIYDIWRNSIKYHTIVLLPSRKLVVRPMLTDGLQIHLAAAWKQGFVQHILPLSQTFMIHARDHTEYFLPKRLPYIDEMFKNLENFTIKHNLRELIDGLPKKEVVLGNFNKCLGVEGNQWLNIVHTVEKRKKELNGSRCHSFFQCDMGEIKHECINVNTNWTTSQFYGVSISILNSAQFIKLDHCSY